jgi:lipopolysaccharide/colanic/teichoic acid biosynthesis glycosyltransferase
MPLGKRAFDIVVSAISIVVLSPLLLLIALLVRIFIGPPVLFLQERPGYKARPFRIIKFRTMTEAQDARGAPLPDSQRLTPLGRWLRLTSLDELPELFNILRGDMSFIGPRPLLMEYLPLYSPQQMRRHEVPPGLTGWAQVNGRNALSWPERFDLDVWYVDHRSLWLEVRILFLTIWKVLSREGVNQPGQATMRKFTGNRD